jgi:hypothetical protein
MWGRGTARGRRACQLQGRTKQMKASELAAGTSKGTPAHSLCTWHRMNNTRRMHTRKGEAYRELRLDSSLSDAIDTPRYTRANDPNAMLSYT